MTAEHDINNELLSLKDDPERDLEMWLQYCSDLRLWNSMEG